MAELLLELLSEEIPARMQTAAAEGLRRLVAAQLEAAGVGAAQATGFSTPRRLVLAMEGLPPSLPGAVEEKRGPRVGAPDEAIQGFLRANGLTLRDCVRRATDKGEFWFAAVERPGRPTPEVLGDVLPQAIQSLVWPKSMRWGDAASNPMRWVRPLRRVLCLFDGRALPLRLPLAGVVCDGRTVGHRVHAPAPFAVATFGAYAAGLRARKVVLDAAERRRIVAAEAGRLAAAEGLRIKDDPALLDEVAGLVEWPVARIGRIDDEFMTLPPEVLSTAMRTHQKYFSTLDAEGRPAPRFVLVADIEAEDGGRAVVAGNERVLRARLADARFFRDQDRARKLEDRVPDLAGVLFHARLGTLGDKTARLQMLAAALAPFVPDCDPALARRAALLAKADLTTGLVGEFPELQGVMGRHYALDQGETEAVADAIGEQYAPLGPNDRCPAAPVGVALALADKIDTLYWFFAAGERPTGSKDPFALRRAALGIVRLILENRLRLPLREAFALAAAGDALPAGERDDGAVEALLAFFAERLKAHLRGRQVRRDLIDAVFALDHEDDLARLLARVEALEAFLGGADGANLLVAHKRAANIVAIEERKDGRSYAGAAVAALLDRPEERDLFESLVGLASRLRPPLEEERFDDAMTILAGLRAPVDAFFDRVKVNCAEADRRANRLKLLSQIRAATGAVADFSRIEG